MAVRLPSPLIALLLTSLVAGCTGTADPPGVDGPDDGGCTPATDGSLPSDCEAAPRPEALVPPFDAPELQVGDWWRYQIDHMAGDSYTTTILVHDEDTDRYHITADDEELILRASFLHYPNLGPIEKGTLAQWIHGTKVQDLRFPMENGTWSGTYRDSAATWNTTFEALETPNGPVPGFTTTMAYEDGLTRIQQSWSPVTKWYTHYVFDYDGVAPADVTIQLLDWGTNHTGTFPLVEIIDGVHRPFPAFGLPPDPNALPAEENRETFSVEADDASILWGMFAGAGGRGVFQAELNKGDGSVRHEFPWRPEAAGSHFAWGEIENAGAGDWEMFGEGAAEDFAFLFLEAYEARFSTGTLPVQ